MHFELYADIILAILLIATIFYSFLLNRKLTELRNSQQEFQGLLSDFGQATHQAEASLANLRQAGDEVGANLEGMIGDGRDLHDELKIMTETGNELADRIERGLVGRGKAAPEPADPARDQERSESERELLAAIRQAR
jgi:hypothetical protein